MKSNILDFRYDKQLRNEWAKWMDRYRWSWFITITYKDPGVYKKPRTVEETLKGGRWLHKTAGAARSALFVEPFHMLAGYHLHGLMYFKDGIVPPQPKMQALEERTTNKFGPSRILPAWQGRASSYVTKYTGFSDMDSTAFDPLGDWENPISR
jgi:hypothetical protein